MTNLATIFAVGFASVFAAGFQSRAVNHGNYALAAANSFVISTLSASLWTMTTKPDVGWAGWLTYGIAGSMAITLAMYTHQRWFKRNKSGSKFPNDTT